MNSDSKNNRVAGWALFLLGSIAACPFGCASEPGCSAVWRMAPGEEREGDVEVRVGTVSLDSCLAEVTGADEGIAQAELTGAQTAGTRRCSLGVRVVVAEDAAPGKRDIDFQVRYEYHDTATDEIIEESESAKLCVIVE